MNALINEQNELLNIVYGPGNYDNILYKIYVYFEKRIMYNENSSVIDVAIDTILLIDDPIFSMPIMQALANRGYVYANVAQKILNLRKINSAFNECVEEMIKDSCMRSINLSTVRPHSTGFWWAKSENKELMVKRVYLKDEELWADSIKIDSPFYDGYRWAGPILEPS